MPSQEVDATFADDKSATKCTCHWDRVKKVHPPDPPRPPAPPPPAPPRPPPRSSFCPSSSAPPSVGRSVGN
eukprot:9477081-Pyramimonas_sp.AAC.1